MFTQLTRFFQVKLFFLSLQIDMGQIEGAFMMGVGLWTSEELKYDPVTGKLLTFDTWVRKRQTKKILSCQDYNGKLHL